MKNIYVNFLCFFACLFTISACEKEAPIEPTTCVPGNSYTSDNPFDVTKYDDQTLVGFARSGGIGYCNVRYATNPNFVEKFGGPWIFRVNCKNFTTLSTVGEVAGILKASIISGKCY